MFMPIIPMILVNGAEGIASGYSTNIPSYNPLDIVNWIDAWLCLKEGDTMKKHPKLVPWYRGFSGSIELVYKILKF